MSNLKIEGEKPYPDVHLDELGNTFITGTNVRGNSTAFSQSNRFALDDALRQQCHYSQTANSDFTRPKIMQKRINKAMTPGFNIRPNFS